MSIRETLQNNAVAVGIVGVVVIVAAWWFIISGMTDVSLGSQDAYYIDLASGELVTHEPTPPPFDLPSGGTAVQAHVFACGDCESNEQFVAYVSKYNKAAREEMNKPKDQREGMVIADGQLVSLYSDADDWEPQWVRTTSGGAMQIQDAAFIKCENAVACEP